MPEELSHVGWAQVKLLTAIYYELRHGNDLKARHTAALQAHAAALEDHANELDNAGRAMRGLGDSLGRRQR